MSLSYKLVSVEPWTNSHCFSNNYCCWANNEIWFTATYDYLWSVTHNPNQLRLKRLPLLESGTVGGILQIQQHLWRERKVVLMQDLNPKHRQLPSPHICSTWWIPAAAFFFCRHTNLLWQSIAIVCTNLLNPCRATFDSQRGTSVKCYSGYMSQDCSGMFR